MENIEKNEAAEPSEPTEKKSARRFEKLRLAPNFSLWGLIKFGLGALVFSWCAVNWHADVPIEQLEAKYFFEDSRWVEIDGQKVHCRVSGKGPETVVLLHGNGSSLHSWASWTGILKAEYRVVSVDLPGFGLTGPSADGSYSIYAQAAFLEKFLLALDIKTCALVGSSMGGGLAWFYAAENPEKVKKLVLIDATGLGLDRPTPLSAFLAKTPILNQIVQKITPKSLFRNQLEEVFSNDALVTDSIIDRHFELFLRTGNRKAFCDRARVSENRPPEDFLKKVRCPTLILWGAEDVWIPTEHAYRFHKEIRRAALKIYSGVGHVPHEEAPEQTAGDVRLFFQGKF